MPSERTISAPSARVRLVVASSVMLTFISFWRAAAVVLNDLGSSAFYAGGIAEEAIGKSAPWFILGVMLFSFAVRAVYVESCSGQGDWADDATVSVVVLGHGQRYPELATSH